MDARELQSAIGYLGQERCARKILIDEKLAKAEDVALMTDVEVYGIILEHYQVVAVENEDITIVKNEDMETYNKIVRFLSR